MAESAEAAAKVATAEVASHRLSTRWVLLAKTLALVVPVVPVATPHQVSRVLVATVAAAVSLVPQVFRWLALPVLPAVTEATAVPVEAAEAPALEELTVTVVTEVRPATAPTDPMAVQPLRFLPAVAAVAVGPAEAAVMVVRPERAWVPRVRRALPDQKVLAATAATAEQVSMDRWA